MYLRSVESASYAELQCSDIVEVRGRTNSLKSVSHVTDAGREFSKSLYVNIYILKQLFKNVFISTTCKINVVL